jgi:hypothetical protein
MSTILSLVVLCGAIALVYKLINHKDNTPDPLEAMEQNAKEIIAKAEQQAKEPPKCGCGRSPTGYCVGLHKLSEAEWAISDKNPNRVEVAPVVVTADTPATPAEAPVEAEPKAKKPRAAKPKAAETADEKPKKPRAKKAK